MAGQLDRLVAASTMRSLRLGVIPFTARLPVVPVQGFWMFDTDLVRVETFTAELHITDTTELRSYARIFADLGRAAVYGTQARTIITHAIADLDTVAGDAGDDATTSRRRWLRSAGPTARLVWSLDVPGSTRDISSMAMCSRVQAWPRPRG